VPLGRWIAHSALARSGIGDTFRSGSSNLS